MRALLVAPLLIALAAPLPAPAVADAPAARVRVVLLDGRVLEGEDATTEGTRLSVKAAGGTVTVDLADVLEASLGAEAGSGNSVPGGPAVEVDLVNRDLLRGALVRGLGEKGFVVLSPALGEVLVPLEAVSVVRFPAALAKADDPPAIEAGDRKSDRFVLAGGDLLDGTLRSVETDSVKVRTAAGAERSLRTDALLGFALAPLPRKPETGLRLQVVLAEGSRVTASEVLAEGTAWRLRGLVDGRDRTVSRFGLSGLSVRGGHGTPLPDLAPSAVEVKPFWGEDPMVLPLRPRFDRAFTLDRGAPPPLRLGGRTFLRGVSMFSGTTATWSLEGKGFRTFAAAVGVDDAGPKGAVAFEILVDGRSAWRSPAVRTIPAGTDPVPVPPVDVSGAKTLSLVVHAGPDDDVQDYADWVKCVLLP